MPVRNRESHNSPTISRVPLKIAMSFSHDSSLKLNELGKNLFLKVLVDDIIKF